MGFFKSKEQQREERRVEMKKVLARIQREVAATEQHARDYADKAKRASQMGWDSQFDLLRQAARRSLEARRRLERQKLALETALQMKEQAEGQAEFARAMGDLSGSFAGMFGAASSTAMQMDFERALAGAESLEQRMEIFLESASASLADGSAGEGARDGELDRLLGQETPRPERGRDARAEEDFAALERELEKLRRG